MRKKTRQIVPIIVSSTAILVSIILAINILNEALNKRKISGDLRDTSPSHSECIQEEYKMSCDFKKIDSSTNVKIRKQQPLNDGIHTTSENQTKSSIEELMKKISKETSGSSPR